MVGEPLPITSNVVLAEWQPVSTAGDSRRDSDRRARSEGGGRDSELTQVHPITGRTMSFSSSSGGLQMAPMAEGGDGGQQGPSEPDLEDDEGGRGHYQNNTF